MEIIYRNLMRLMAAGAFTANAEVEPMSRYKWNQMLTLAATYEVADYVSSGIISAVTRNASIVPKDVAEEAYARYNAQASARPKSEPVADFTKNAAEKFANLYLSHKLKRLVYNEIHSIDTSTATLTLLYKIIDNINGVIYCGIDFRKIIDLGLYLRLNGDKIDFVKAEQWLRALGLRKPSCLVGSYLISVFGFNVNEVPFIAKQDRKALEKAVKPLKYTLRRAMKEPDLLDCQARLAQRMRASDIRLLVRLGYFPSEVACKFVAGVAKSLSNIEE